MSMEDFEGAYGTQNSKMEKDNKVIPESLNTLNNKDDREENKEELTDIKNNIINTEEIKLNDNNDNKNNNDNNFIKNNLEVAEVTENISKQKTNNNNSSEIIKQNEETISINEIRETLKEYYSKVSSFVFKFKNNNPRLFNILAISLFIVLLYPKLLILFIFSVVSFVMGLMYIVPTKDMESFNNIKANSLNELQRAQKINSKITEIQKRKNEKVIIKNSEFSPEMKLALDNFMKDFIKNYIDRWWVNLNHSNGTEFTDEISNALNKAFSKINLYARNVSITSLIVPIFNHLIEQMQLYREFEASGLPPNVYLKKYSYSKLSKYTTRESEIKILRDLGAIIANQVLESKEKDCLAVFSFIQEIMATTVLLPVVEKLSDPYFINNLIYTKLGDNVTKPKKRAPKVNNVPNKRYSQVSLVSSTTSYDSQSNVTLSLNQNDNPSTGEVSSYDKYNNDSTTVNPFDQRSDCDVSMSLSDVSTINKISFEEGIKDKKMFSEFNIFLKNQDLDELLYLYIKINQFKECFGNEEYELDIIENYGNNIVHSFIATDRHILSENLIHPMVLDKYHIHVDANVVKESLFDELQKEVSLTINQKYWPVFLKNYYPSNDDSSSTSTTLNSELNEGGQELEGEYISDPYALPPNVKKFEDYAMDDMIVDINFQYSINYNNHNTNANNNNKDSMITSFINCVPPLRKKIEIKNRYNIFKHRRHLSESDSITFKTFGTDYISKMKSTYGRRYPIMKNQKRIDRHLDHAILLTQNKITQCEKDIDTKNKELMTVDQTLEHVMDNFNRIEDQDENDEELFQLTMKNITSKKMEYQLEIEELHRLKASLENKMIELKQHLIYKPKYKIIIIIDPSQNSVLINEPNLSDDYQFQLEVYNMENVNHNEKYVLVKTYKEFYQFHCLLKLKYRNIPDFPTRDYIIHKRKLLRDQWISRRGIPLQQRESIFTDIYQIHLNELVKELEIYINLLSNIAIIGENPDFIRFVTRSVSNAAPIHPLRGSSLYVNQSAQQQSSEMEDSRRNRRSYNNNNNNNNDKRLSTGSLSSMMNFIKPSRSQHREKSSTSSSSFSLSRINEKINDTINDKLFNSNSNSNSNTNTNSNSNGNGNGSNGGRLRNLSITSTEQVKINEVSNEPQNTKTTDEVANINMDQEAIDMILECIICLVEEIFQLNNPDQWMRQKAFQVVKQVALKSFSAKINTILCAFLGKVFSEDSFTNYINSLNQNLFHKDENEEEEEEEEEEGEEEGREEGRGEEYFDEIEEVEKEKEKEINNENNRNGISLIQKEKENEKDNEKDKDKNENNKEIIKDEKERIKNQAKKILLTSNKIPLHYISKVVGTNNTQNGMVRLFEMFQVPEFNRHLMCAVLQSIVICVFDNDDIETF